MSPALVATGPLSVSVDLPVPAIHMMESYNMYSFFF